MGDQATFPPSLTARCSAQGWCYNFWRALSRRCDVRQPMAAEAPLQVVPGDAAMPGPESPASPDRPVSRLSEDDDDDSKGLVSVSKPKQPLPYLKDLILGGVRDHNERERAHSDGDDTPSPPMCGAQNSEELLLSASSTADSTGERPGHRRSSTCDVSGLLGSCANKRSSFKGGSAAPEIPTCRPRMESVLNAAETDAYTSARESPRGCAFEGAGAPASSSACPPPQRRADGVAPEAVGAPFATPGAAAAAAAAAEIGESGEIGEIGRESRRLPPQRVVASVEQETALSVRKFNEKCTRGVQYAIERGVLPETPEAVADYLRSTKVGTASCRQCSTVTSVP